MRKNINTQKLCNNYMSVLSSLKNRTAISKIINVYLYNENKNETCSHSTISKAIYQTVESLFQCLAHWNNLFILFCRKFVYSHYNKQYLQNICCCCFSIQNLLIV